MTYPSHPAPWWYRLAARVIPSRCREIPEATDPTGTKILLRQVALTKRRVDEDGKPIGDDILTVYLQQFAGPEDVRWMHSHQWMYTCAIGLWGQYVERRLRGFPVVRKAPYLYAMDETVVHHVQEPSAGHTSIFIGLFRDDNLKYYHDSFGRARPRLWSDHIKVMVARL